MVELIYGYAITRGEELPVLPKRFWQRIPIQKHDQTILIATGPSPQSELPKTVLHEGVRQGRKVFSDYSPEQADSLDFKLFRVAARERDIDREVPLIDGRNGYLTQNFWGAAQIPKSTFFLEAIQFFHASAHGLSDLLAHPSFPHELLPHLKKYASNRFFTEGLNRNAKSPFYLGVGDQVMPTESFFQSSPDRETLACFSRSKEVRITFIVRQSNGYVKLHGDGGNGVARLTDIQKATTIEPHRMLHLGALVNGKPVGVGEARSLFEGIPDDLFR